MKMMPAAGSRARVGRKLRRGEDVLLAHSIAARVLPGQGIGEVDRSVSIPQILLVHLLDGLQVIRQRLLETPRQHGHAVFGPFAVPDQG
jgi:hypothetical protein